MVYKFKKLMGRNDFSFPFRKIITHYRRIGYNLNIMRKSSHFFVKKLGSIYYVINLGISQVLEVLHTE